MLKMNYLYVSLWAFLLMLTTAMTSVFAQVTHEETESGVSSGVGSISTTSTLVSATDHLYLAAVTTRSNVSVSSVTGLGLTWTLIKAQCAARSQTGIEVWAAIGTPTGDDVVSAVFSGTPANAVITVSRFSGVNAADTLGMVVSVNTLGTDGACSGGTDGNSYSFSLTPESSDGLIYVAAALRNRTHTPGASFTELAENSTGSGGNIVGAAINSQTLTSGSAITVDGTFSGTVDWAVIALELKTTAAGPTDISLSNDTIPENSADDSVVGTLTTAHADPGATFTYSLNNDAGGRFKIVGDELQVADSTLLDFEAAKSHVVNIRSTDNLSAFTDKAFTIYLSNVFDETPSDISLSDTTVSETSSNGTVVGTFSTTDSDSGDAFTYTLSNNAGGRFQVSGNELQVANSSLLDYDTDSTHAITVRSTDSGGLYLEKPFTILLLDSAASAASFEIREFMAKNAASLKDEDSTYQDWIEIYNSGASSANIGGWYISDSTGWLTRWQFPSTVIPAGGRLVVFASGKDRTGSELHTNFSLKREGEYLALTAPDGVSIASVFPPTFPLQTDDVSFGTLSGDTMYFSPATPGTANVAGSFDVLISDSTVEENSANDTYIGTLIPLHHDINDVSGYSLLDDAGGRFKVVGSEIQVADSSLLDYETNTSHTVEVRTTYGGGTLDKTFTINILNLSEQPTGVIITEFLANNTTGLLDDDGDYSDWIEIFNNSGQTVNLTGWFLTDDPDTLYKWVMPSRFMADGEYLIVYASGKNRTVPQLHTNFKLGSGGEYLALHQPDTNTVASEFDPEYPDQMSDVSYGIFNGSYMYLNTPTPGAANTSDSFDLAISNNEITENSPDSTTVGKLFPLHHDASDAFTYSLLDDAGGRFHVVGNKIEVADSSLLDYETNTSHSIEVRVSYNGGSTFDKTFTINVLNLSELPDGVIINEFLASNDAVLADLDGEYEDWIEIYNGSGQNLNLGGWFLSDDPDTLYKWTLPSVTVNDGDYLVVFASGKNLTGSELHTNFKLSSGGEYLALTQPDTITMASIFSPEFPVQLTDISYGKMAGGYGYFSTPTPDAANTIASVDIALTASSVIEGAATGTLIGNLITMNTPDSGFTYTLLDDAGGRFQLSGSELQVDNGSLLDYSVNTSHTISIRSQYGAGQMVDKNLSITVMQYYPDFLEISEFMASNDATIQDEDGDYSDWIEIHNTGSVSVDLDGYYLTDSDGNLTKWQFPSVTLDADSYLVVFASSKDRTGSELHTSYKLSAGGEYLGLVLPDGVTVISEYSPQYPAQSADISYGLFNGAEQYFNTPTPGSVNTDGTLPVAALNFSSKRGFYSSSLNLAITTSTPSANIRYTLDGSTPTETHGTLYSSVIPITTTTVVRAIGYLAGYESTSVETHSYLYLNDVINQPDSISGYPIIRYSLGGGDKVPHDHEMDPVITGDPAYSGSLIKGLEDIPSMLISVDPDSIYGVDGFYDGDDVIRRMSVELLYKNDASKNDQADGGIQSHSHNRLKRSLRLDFSSDYGPSKWKTTLFEDAPLNGETAADEIKHVILRGGNNRAWTRKWNPDNSAFTEDQWFRDSQIAMSGFGSRGNFVHLYINGIYFGLYNPVERLDDHFSATYFGGEDEDWYAVSHSGSKAGGDDTRYDYLTDDLVDLDMSNSTNYDQLKAYLDVTSYSDYIMLAWYGAITDWPDNNWWGGNRNTPVSPFRYYLWDGEWSWDVTKDFDDVNGGWVHPEFTEIESNDPIAEIWIAARANPDFMMLFADRVYKHCFNNGALTDSNSIARWDVLNNYIADAVILESAKWGDCQDSLGEPRRTRDEDWQDEVDAIRDIMDGNVARFITALRAEGYYPAIDPPTYSQRGGNVTYGYSLTLSNPNASGTIYYTLDGSDPRADGGGISGSAQTYSGALMLTSDVTVRVRVKDGADWSAIDEASFTVDGTAVLVNLKVVLEGPNQADSMKTNINSSLPLSQPFNQSPWNYSGTETVSSMPSDIVDWVLIQLRTGTDSPATATRAALLKSNGTVVDKDGSSLPGFSGVTSGTYYVVVYHRNHLGVMSSSAAEVNGSPTLYDFSAAMENSYGTDPVKSLGGGRFGLFSGDCNSDGGVDALDKNQVWRPENGTSWSYSKLSDLNLDGGIDALDLNLFWRASNGKASQIPPEASPATPTSKINSKQKKTVSE